MDQSSIADAVKQICDEKGIPLESVTDTIEAALAAAYRKDFGEKNQNVKVDFDLTTGKSKIFDIKTVVEDVPEEELLEEDEENKDEKEKEKETKTTKKDENKAEAEISTDDEDEAKRFNPKTDIQISDAQAIKKSYKIDDVIKTELEVPGDFGRMAAQTAKQVIIQKLRESERETLYEEFKDKKGEILVGTVQRREGNLVLIDLGRLTALLPPDEQIRNENYTPGAHLKVYIMSVAETTKGPEVIVSRSHPEIVKKLFFLEIPEIANGIVEIKSVSREAGGRSKIAVWTDQENIDPIGSCIGQRGARIQTIISELKGEKVDIIKYSDDPVEYIGNALSPAKILDIQINEEEKTAIAKVAEDQLSLAIGKAGQNVRLAAKLTGWKIDIVSETEKKDDEEEKSSEGDSDDSKDDKVVETTEVEETSQDETKDVKKEEAKKDKEVKKEKKTAKTKITKKKETKKEKE
ncbi:MAG: transcription termination/antitermination protein NusA [Parcubacteria group bacterium]|nr:transcription termination/antitermination protein NusA [Parcubacteria group bacterium]|tara:strand:- start:614 stop:2005 length:1392 start_codon:yes stop_codon:yes gene_type:complete